MAQQPLAGPAPAPALVFTAREPSELLKQRYGENEEFLEVSYLPPSLAGAFAGGYKDTEGKIVFPRSMIAAMALLAMLRLNFHQYISDEVITHGMGRPALALGANFLLDKPAVSGLFTGATLMEDFMAILNKRHMAAHSVGPGTYHKRPKDFKQVLALFGLVRHVSQAVGLKEPPVVSSFLYQH